MIDPGLQGKLRAPLEPESRSQQSLAVNRPARTPRKIAFVQTQAENAGAQEIARQLAQGFAQRGWATRQVFFFRRTDSFDRDDNVFFCARRRPSTPVDMLKLLFELYGEFRREAPDVVVTMQHYGNLIAAPIARLAGVRLIVANQLSSAETIPGAVRIADRLLGMSGLYDHIVVNSVHTEAAYSAYPHAYSQRLKRIDHGFFDKSTTMEKAQARRLLGLPEDGELLGCAARLHPLKQLDLAIRLLTVDKAQRLVLAGQGPDLERLDGLARELGVRERVHFAGELDARQMGVLLAALDCFVFPSAAETFGLAPVEAAQAGVPVVVNDIETLREVLAIDAGPCALFVDAHDTLAFAAAVRRALDDRALNETLATRGRQLANRYPLDAMIDEYLELMDSAPT
jgi:glycosyltransferase involved in cell wall biosynthesis